MCNGFPIYTAGLEGKQMEPVYLGCLMLRVALHSHPGHINQGIAEAAEQAQQT